MSCTLKSVTADWMKLMPDLTLVLQCPTHSCRLVVFLTIIQVSRSKSFVVLH